MDHHFALSALRDALSLSKCAHCGKPGNLRLDVSPGGYPLDLKRCARCKQVAYCGAECQKAGWKVHKPTCEPLLPLREFKEKFVAARAANDWRVLLKMEWRMEEMLEGLTDTRCNWVLDTFIRAHDAGYCSTSSRHHSISSIRLEELNVIFLGKLQRFRDQGGSMCSIAQHKLHLGEPQQAGIYFNKARDLGAQHGFFSVECRACTGLGACAMVDGRHEEAVLLYRNALAASNLVESDENHYQINALQQFIQALFRTNAAIDELDELVPSYREATREESRAAGSISVGEFRSLCYSARLHEVLCICTPCREPACFSANSEIPPGLRCSCAPGLSTGVTRN